jgi:hypothetical protein
MSSVYFDHEKIELRAAAQDYVCWSWAERYGDEPQCGRIIAKGELHAVSTIFPGRDSGYADGGWDGRGNPIGPHPVTSRFCMPCSQRWTNLRDAVAKLRGEAS